MMEATASAEAQQKKMVMMGVVKEKREQAVAQLRYCSGVDWQSDVDDDADGDDSEDGDDKANAYCLRC